MNFPRHGLENIELIFEHVNNVVNIKAEEKNEIKSAIKYHTN